MVPNHSLVLPFDRAITEKQNIWKLAQLPSPGLFVIIPVWTSLVV